MKTLIALAGGFVLVVVGSIAYRKLRLGSTTKTNQQATAGPTPQDAIHAAQNAIGGNASSQDAATLVSAGGSFFEAAAKGIAALESVPSTPPAPTGAPSPGAQAVANQKAEWGNDPELFSGPDASPSLDQIDYSQTPNVSTGQGASNPQITDASSTDWGQDTTALAAQDTTPGVTVAAGDYSDAITQSEAGV